MNQLTSQQINELAMRLEYTKDKADNVAREITGDMNYILTPEDLKSLSNKVKQCNECGYWCDTTEGYIINGEFTCCGCMDDKVVEF